MVNPINGKRETNFFIFTGLILLFLLLTFNFELAIVYIFMMVVSQWWYLKLDSPIPIERTIKNRTGAFFRALIAYAVFLIIVTLVLKLPPFLSAVQEQLKITDITTQSIFQLLATTTPRLEGSPVFTILAWGLIVPLIETGFFHGNLFAGLAEYARKQRGINVSTTKLTTATIILILTIAALFALFHITAKGVGTIPLLITFIFSIISSIMVIRDQETSSAMQFHIISNTTVVLSTLGLLPSF